MSMYNQFLFGNGSNPYITKTNKELFRIIMKYYVSQFDDHSFVTHGLIEWNGSRKTRDGIKDILRSFAIEWQRYASETSYSMMELMEWQNFFEEYGNRYGLLTEFHENGII